MRTLVVLRIPALRNRDAQEATVEVENERVVAVSEGIGFMDGWTANMLRKYCKAVGWKAVNAGNINPEEEGQHG